MKVVLAILFFGYVALFILAALFFVLAWFTSRGTNPDDYGGVVAIVAGALAFCAGVVLFLPWLLLRLIG